MSMTMQTAQNLGDFSPLYKFTLSFIVAPKVTGFAASSTLQLRVLMADKPSINGQPIDIWLQGVRVKQPGIYTSSDTLAITFASTIDQSVETSLAAWSKACYDPNTGKSKANKDVRATIRLTGYNRQDTAIAYWDIKGAYCESFTFGDQFSGETSDISKPELTLGYNEFTFTKGKSVVEQVIDAVEDLLGG